MTQFSINQGISRFGKEGVDAVQTEMKQLHDRAMLKPVVNFHCPRNGLVAVPKFLKQKGKIKDVAAVMVESSA